MLFRLFLRVAGTAAFLTFFLAFGILFAFGLIPHRRLIGKVSECLKRRGQARKARQIQMRFFQRPWGSLVFRLFTRLMRMRLHVQLPPREALAGLAKRPCIVVSNHGHTLDIVALHHVAWLIDLPHLAWVVKRELKDHLRYGRVLRPLLTAWKPESRALIGKEIKRTLELGYSMEASDFAFVTRTDPDADLEEIRVKSALAFADGTSMEIFPEGTRAKGGPETRFPYAHLKPPKEKGFLEIWRNMPGAPIVSCTLHWRLRTEPTGKTMYDGAMFFLGDFHLEVTLHPYPPTEEAARQWLKEEWARKDMRIDALH